MSVVDNGLAFIFPGQGSQSVGMLAELAEAHPEVEATFRTASETLGYDLWDLVKQGPEDRLNSTEFTQPAMLAAGVAAWRVWCEKTEIRPGLMAGHSLGEYTALVCAGALAFEAGLKLVRERARLMQAAVPPEAGAMAAVLGLKDEQIVAVCREGSTDTEIATAANFNAPGQVVIAGDRAAVERAIALARESGAKRALLLPVSVPSHCPLMQPAADRFMAILEATPIASPGVGVVHNVDVALHPAPDELRIALREQLYGAVRWADSILSMAARGIDRYVECGPGRVLAGLNKRIVPDARTEALFDTTSLAKALVLTQ